MVLLEPRPSNSRSNAWSFLQWSCKCCQIWFLNSAIRSNRCHLLALPMLCQKWAILLAIILCLGPSWFELDIFRWNSFLNRSKCVGKLSPLPELHLPNFLCTRPFSRPFSFSLFCAAHDKQQEDNCMNNLSTPHIVDRQLSHRNNPVAW